jgi:ABC-type bacteriocin/lantibiotic exporter with double-glycine peptidase domain
LYRNPSLLLLDEATSALDVATEKAVIDSVYGLKGERTLIIIAHRLSTVRRCDRIILLERGRVSAHGTWDELLEASDLFRVLARLDGPLSRSDSAT